MKWDEDVFGLSYDLDIYMVVAVDFFNMGAMENKGLNVFNSKYVLANQNQQPIPTILILNQSSVIITSTTGLATVSPVEIGFS